MNMKQVESLRQLIIKNGFSDRDAVEFRDSVVDGIQIHIKNNRWEAMSNYQSFLQGKKEAFEEVCDVLNDLL